MIIDNIKLTLLIGPEIALPAPMDLSNALVSAEVTESSDGKVGFQLVFQDNRDGLAGLLDFPLMNNPLLKTFNRVTLIAVVGLQPEFLINGFITHQQIVPTTGNSCNIVISGGDLGTIMDLAEHKKSYPEMADPDLLAEVFARYLEYGFTCEIIPPTYINQPLPEGRVPSQSSTDWEFIHCLAQRYGYQFYIKPGLEPRGYWGPPATVSIPKPALTTNMGAFNNIEDVSFVNDALTPVTVSGLLMDPTEDETTPVKTEASILPPLSLEPTGITNVLNTRTVLPENFQGQDELAVEDHAQGKTDISATKAVSATGTLNTLTYESVLHIGDLVGMRGVGWSYDGMYHVDSVKHVIKRGSYKQEFELTRDGVGSLEPVVLI